jgi:hypothetical protein
MPGRVGITLRNQALYRGLLGRSPFWMALFVFFALGRVRHAVFGRTPILVATDVLAPGQSVTITPMERPPRGRRARRRAAKGAQSAG